MNRKTALRMLICLMLVMAGLTTVALAETTAHLLTKSTTTEKQQDDQLKPGGKGKYVKAYQKQLKNLGYYTVGLSNVYTEKTKQATKDFQLANGLQQTGKGDAATRAMLKSGDAKSRLEYDKENFQNELKNGNDGDQVSQYQDRLIVFGYLKSATGEFDSDTVRATKYFQQANKLAVNGVASRTVRQKLNSGTGVVSFTAYDQAERSQGFSKGKYGLRVEQVQSRLQELGYYNGKIDSLATTSLGKAIVKFKQYNNFKTCNTNITASDRKRIESETALRYDDVNNSDTLKPGDKGASVLRAQYALKDLKFYNGNYSGKYDSKTKNAVKKFQKSNNLYANGILYAPHVQLLMNKAKPSNVISPKVAKIIIYAQAQLGKKYANRAKGPKTFDCSGFTWFVFDKVNISLKGSAAAQSEDSHGDRVIDEEDIMPGDLLFFDTSTANRGKVNHVGICVSSAGGSIKFIHASSAGRKVITSKFKDASNSNFYGKRFLWGRRMC